MNTLIKQNDRKSVITEALPLDQNPALVYLAGLRETGRRTQKQSLDFIAGLLQAMQIASRAIGLDYNISIPLQSGLSLVSNTNLQQ